MKSLCLRSIPGSSDLSKEDCVTAAGNSKWLLGLITPISADHRASSVLQEDRLVLNPSNTKRSFNSTNRISGAYSLRAELFKQLNQVSNRCLDFFI